ncbi:MAG: 6-phosphogluconolactonase [Prochlorothrix sp.]|nr:6-phosphogluconolactonase [Prochlorothrix sp.]
MSSVPADPILEILPDRSALIVRALDLVVAQIRESIADRGFCTLALAGGSTPKPLYEALAQQELPWDKIHIFWGDERYVPPSDTNSNEGMARAAWLDRVPFPPENLHPMPTGAGDPAMDAATHDRELQDFFQGQSGPFPALDLVLLGIGPDGHTASLFPHTAALEVVDRRVTVGNKDGEPRITMTYPVLNQARLVLFLVTGDNKQPALQEIFSPTGDDRHYPARAIRPQGSLYWLLDAAAGAVFASP